MIAADLTDPHSLNKLPSGITHVVYMPTPDRRAKAEYRAVFKDGLRHLLMALNTSRLARVMLVSSTAVYGNHEGDWVDENTPANPPRFNGEVLLETEGWLAAQNLPAIIVRLSGLYGPGRAGLFERLLAGKVCVPRRQPFWSNRMHVDDAAAAIVHLLHLACPQPLYLGTDDMPLPLDVRYDHLARLLGAPRPTDGPAPAGVGNKRLNNARLRHSGFCLQWPDARKSYAALLQQANY